MTIPHHPRVAAAISLVFAAALAGCSSDGTCETSAICEAGTFCFEGACVASLPPGSYTSPGSPAIAYGGVISPTSSTCPVPPTTADPIVFPAGRVQDLAPAFVGETVSFEVPAGTASVTIHLQAESAVQRVAFLDGHRDYNYVIPAEVELPNGDVLYEYLDALTSPTDPSLESAYFAPNPWTATFTVPAGHRLADLALAKGSLPSGTWRLRLADYQSECGLFGGCTSGPTGRYRATVVSKPGPYVASGALDLSVYFASGPPGEVTALAASSDPSYQRFVEGIDRLLGGAGIVLGTVRFFEIPNAVASEFYSTDVREAPPCGQLARLFALARPAPTDDGVRLFLVDDLNSGPNGLVVGLTGSIPGPTGIPGAVTSGIVMSAAGINLDLMGADRLTRIGPCDTSRPELDLHCNADLYAYVAAHEIGHWLGLYHPTEATGDLYDPLADTATCGCDVCSPHGCPAPYPPGMYAAACAADEGSCAGGKNLMFWQVDEALSRGDVSREQGLVMRASPAVKWGIP